MQERTTKGVNLASAHLTRELRVRSHVYNNPFSSSRFRVKSHLQAFKLLSRSRSLLVRHTNKSSNKDATCVAYQGRNGAEPGRVLVGTSTVSTQDSWVRWRAVLHFSFHTPWTRLDASERSLRNGSTRSQQLVAKSTAASTARIAGSGHLACFVRALRAHGAVTGRSSYLDLSDPPLRVVNVRLHGLPALLSAVSILSF